tara:strand:- start:593 stop:934 length:342 start_codon:yes stop_codon:yes gene_type:complete
MSRYRNTRVFTNDEEFYKFLRKKRNSPKAIRMFETPIMHNPSVEERASIMTANHIWKLGDRYYSLAAQYYGQPQYWWIIAWYNGMPTEADVQPGDLIAIPTDLEEALRVLRSI